MPRGVEHDADREFWQGVKRALQMLVSLIDRFKLGRMPPPG